MRSTGVEFREMADTDINGWIGLGIFGGVIIGFGFANIIAAWLHQYLGHFVTILCILIGLIIMGRSLAVMQRQP